MTSLAAHPVQTPVSRHTDRWTPPAHRPLRPRLPVSAGFAVLGAITAAAQITARDSRRHSQEARNATAPPAAD
jgi:hypothetical protein